MNITVDVTEFHNATLTHQVDIDVSEHDLELIDDGDYSSIKDKVEELICKGESTEMDRDTYDHLYSINNVVPEDEALKNE